MTTFEHAGRIARYNGPIYAGAGGAVLVCAGVAAWSAAPLLLRGLAGAAAVVIVWFAGASFLAFHWMFDRSELLGGRWLPAELPRPPRAWVQINNGLDETSVPVSEIYPDASGTTLDIYDPATMRAPALTRARRGTPAARARWDAIALDARGSDLVLVMLAAHEIPGHGRRARFFGELARIVAADGRVVVVEHLRDVVAALTFGPGLFHFRPRREWLRLGREAGLTLVHERAITPYVRVFVYRP